MESSYHTRSCRLCDASVRTAPSMSSPGRSLVPLPSGGKARSPGSSQGSPVIDVMTDVSAW